MATGKDVTVNLVTAGDQQPVRRPFTIRSVEIELDNALASDGSVKIAGHEIKRVVTGIHLDARPGELTRVEIDVMAMEGVSFRGAAYVGIAEGTAEVLESLGWTPPYGARGPRGRLWMWITPYVLDLIDQGATDELPSDWTILRRVCIRPWAAGSNSATIWLAEVSVPNMPAEAEGQVCAPTFQRHGKPGSSALTVADWGIPKPPLRDDDAPPMQPEAAQDSAPAQVDQAETGPENFPEKS